MTVTTREEDMSTCPTNTTRFGSIDCHYHLLILIYESLTLIYICRSVWEERGVIARLLGGKLVHHLLTLSRLELCHLVCSFVWLFVCLFVNLSYFDCLLFTIYWYFQGLSSFLIVLPIYWTHKVGQIAKCQIHHKNKSNI